MHPFDRMSTQRPARQAAAARASAPITRPASRRHGLEGTHLVLLRAGSNHDMLLEVWTAAQALRAAILNTPVTAKTLAGWAGAGVRAGAGCRKTNARARGGLGAQFSSCQAQQASQHGQRCKGPQARHRDCFTPILRACRHPGTFLAEIAAVSASDRPLRLRVSSPGGPLAHYGGRPQQPRPGL